MCKCACMYLFARTCVFVCASVHTGCVRVCVRLQGCVNADVRACGGGCMHICVEECACFVSGPASSPPGNLQWGWLACTANTQTLVLLVLLVLLLLNPLLEPLAAVGPSRIHFHEGHGCPIPQKQLLKFARMQGFGFLWCQRPVEGRFRPLIQAVYICIYMENRIYIRIIRRINTPAKIHIRCTNTGTEKIYLYIRIYTVRIYTAYIYLYGLGQPYIYGISGREITKYTVV